jgi:hypothetical protein
MLKQFIKWRLVINAQIDDYRLFNRMQYAAERVGIIHVYLHVLPLCVLGASIMYQELKN